MRACVFAAALAAGAMLLSGCYSEPEGRLSVRLERFMNLLTASEMSLIDAREYSEAAASLALRMESNADLKRAYEYVLDEENILFFSPDQAVRFFAGSMDGSIRFFRFVRMLRGPELLAFNEGRHAELARLLHARFEARPALAQEYAERIAPKRMQDSDEGLYKDYLWSKHIRPFALLYRFMSEAERAMLVDGDGSDAARSFMGRRGTDPRVQQTLESIYISLPETRVYDFPVMAFIRAALTNIQDRQSRRTLAAVADDIISGRQSREALWAQIMAAGISFPELDNQWKRLEQLENDIAWFDAFVREEIDFFN
jgi:hypothetical protein